MGRLILHFPAHRAYNIKRTGAKLRQKRVLLNGIGKFAVVNTDCIQYRFFHTACTSDLKLHSQSSVFTGNAHHHGCDLIKQHLNQTFIKVVCGNETGKRYIAFTFCVQQYGNIGRYEEFLREIRRNGGLQDNILRVGYQDRMNFGAAPGTARNALCAEMPELELTGERHSPGTLVQKLLNGELDVILVSGRFQPKEAGLCSMVLVHSAMVLLVSKNHPGNVEGATYQSFSKALFLIDSFDNETPTDSMARAHRELQSYGMTAEKIQVLPNRESVYTAIELGQGVTVGNARTQILSSGSILAYPTQTAETLVCVWRGGEKEAVSKRYAQLLQQGYR